MDAPVDLTEETPTTGTGWTTVTGKTPQPGKNAIAALMLDINPCDNTFRLKYKIPIPARGELPPNTTAKAYLRGKLGELWALYAGEDDSIVLIPYKSDSDKKILRGFKALPPHNSWLGPM